MSDTSNLIANDIHEYLAIHQKKDLLRLLTCGSVDDGKSTLIGRLLYDSKLIFEDHMSAIENDSKRFNTTDEKFDLALLVDGLQSEREQGITIDVAYRYFSTEHRKFIIADTPGHEQYTRNMATGASNCDLAIILVDARNGLQLQTYRHSYICSLLGIKHVIVAVNKMDAVGYDQSIYREIKASYRKFAEKLNFKQLRFVPISALRGDNVVNKSDNMAWYPGAPLMQLLNTVKIGSKQEENFRFSVQYVNRPNLDFRGYCGTISSGNVQVGDSVIALPSGKESKIESIVTFDGELKQAQSGMSVTLTLEDEIDISRGDMLVHSNDKPCQSADLSADIVWMSKSPLSQDREYLFKFGCKSTFGHVADIEHKVNINTLEKQEATKLQLNEIGCCRISLNEEVVFDHYQDNRLTGAFIMIDRLDNITVGAGMINKSIDVMAGKENRTISKMERDLNRFVREYFPHWEAKECK